MWQSCCKKIGLSVQALQFEQVSSFWESKCRMNLYSCLPSKSSSCNEEYNNSLKKFEILMWRSSVYLINHVCQIASLNCARKTHFPLKFLIEAYFMPVWIAMHLVGEVLRFLPFSMFLIKAFAQEIITTNLVSGRGLEVSRFQPFSMFLIKEFAQEIITTNLVSGRGF